MLTGQLKRASAIAWLIISAVILSVLLATALLPSDSVRSLASRLSLPHDRPCPLCGMTTAFLSLSRGRVTRALDANSYSLLLYSLFLANELAALGFVSRLAASRLIHRKPRPFALAARPIPN